MLITDKFLADLGVNRQFFLQFPDQGRARLLAGFDLATRKFPFQGVARTALALADKNTAFDFDDCGNNDHGVTFSVPSPMYSTQLLEHFQNPRNVGELDSGVDAVRVEMSNPACGDIMRLAARFENGVVTAVRYKVQGCTASIAAGSVLTELMMGVRREGLAAIHASDIEAALGGLEPASKHAAILCIDAVKRLLEAHQ